MNEFNFTGNPHVTIKVGQAVNFDDTHGSLHVLVVDVRERVRQATLAGLRERDVLAVETNVIYALATIQ